MTTKMDDDTGHEAPATRARRKADGIVPHVSKIMTSYLSFNTVEAAELPSLIIKVGDALAWAQGIGRAGNAISMDSYHPPWATGAGQMPDVLEPLTVTPDAIICLEDGLRFKMMKRHLRVKYNLSPDEYRAKWGLPPDYPMGAPNYSKLRSQMAKESKLHEKVRSRGKAK